MRVFYGLSLNSSIINVFTIETSSNMEFRDQPSCLETDREKDGLERGGGERRRGSLLSEGDVFPETQIFYFLNLCNLHGVNL